MELAITIQTSSVICDVFAIPLCERETYGIDMCTLTQYQQYRQQNYAKSKERQVSENLYSTDNCGESKISFLHYYYLKFYATKFKLLLTHLNAQQHKIHH